MKPFEYIRARSVEEAVGLLATHRERARVLAGGTDLFLRMESGAFAPDYVIDLKGIRDLSGIAFDEERGLRIGALALHADIAAHPAIRQRFTALAQGAACVGSVQMRNRGTLGGNLCNASPAADTAPALVAMGARVGLRGPGGERTLPIEGFFLGPGRTAMRPDEILVEVHVPPTPPRTGSDYQRRTRAAMDIALVGVAAVASLDGGATRCRDVGIALAAVAPVPLRARGAEGLLRGQEISEPRIAAAAAAAMREARPISDIRATAGYRRQMVEVLTRRAMAGAMARARGGG